MATKSLRVIASPNIALIKYWGKKPSLRDDDRNVPLNASISLTLSKAQSQVQMFADPAADNANPFFIQGHSASPKDIEKLCSHQARIESALEQKLPPFRLESENNFPTGTGIASSASAFSALTCAFIAWARGAEFCRGRLRSDPQWLADLARRGSGSACRSLHGPFVKWWDKSIQVIESDWKLYDTIVIFSKTEKTVASTEGHQYAPQSPLFARRLEKIPERLSIVENAIAQQSLDLLGSVIETEADDMHQIMRENPNSIEYQLPATKSFLSAVKALASRDFYYTLDAGPNVHLLSEKPIREQVEKILQEHNLVAEIWEDQTGFGPQL